MGKKGVSKGKKANGKLALRKETVANLNAEQLEAANGGTFTFLATIARITVGVATRAAANTAVRVGVRAGVRVSKSIAENAGGQNQNQSSPRNPLATVMVK